MSNKGERYPASLPKELEDFISQDTYSLLIKGEAGSGKTSLALTILLVLQMHKNCLFLSTRTSPEKLFQHFKWLEDFFDAPKKLNLNENIEVTTDIATFVDARLDEPTTMYERITNELMDVRAPIIIIDSWDAISSLMDNESLLSDASVLQTWRERAGAKIIFVSENKDKTILDSLSDGIIELGLSKYEGRTLRNISLKKLRGIQIKRPEYNFTLNKGFFTTFQPYNPRVLEIVEGKTKSLEKDTILNSLFGGKAHLENSILVQIDNHIDGRIPLILFGKMLLSIMTNNSHTLIHPHTSLKKKYIEAYFKKFLGGTFNEKISWIEPEDNDSTKIVELYKNQAKKTSGKKMMSYLDTGFIDDAKIEDSQKRKEWYKLLEFNKKNMDLVIIVESNKDSSFHSIISKFCELHCRIIEISGTLFFLSEIPWSPLFGIVFSNHKYPETTLEPVV